MTGNRDVATALPNCICELIGPAFDDAPAGPELDRPRAGVDHLARGGA